MSTARPHHRIPSRRPAGTNPEPLEPRRLFAGGAADPAFGAGAAVALGFSGHSSVLNDLLVYPDGAVLAGGYAVPQANGAPAGLPVMALSRYAFNGQLDPTFGTAGQITGTPRGMKGVLDLGMLDDGSFLVLGSSVSGYSTRGNLLLRFLPDGRLDTGFGKSGRAILPISAAALHVTPSNQVYVVGQSERDGAVVRYTAAGRIDTTFASQGTYTTRGLFADEPDTTFVFDSAATDAQGRLLLAGTHRDAAGDADTASDATGPGDRFDVRVVRLQPGGGLDQSFGGPVGGRGYFSAAADLDSALPSDGVAFSAVTVAANSTPILVAAPQDGNDAYVVKLTDAGTPDPAFSADGVADLASNPARYPLAGSIVEEPDGRILFAGNIERSGRSIFSVERLDPDGTPDDTYGTAGVATVAVRRLEGQARATALAPDGSIVVGGIVGTVEAGGLNDSRRFTVARLLRQESPAGQLVPKTLRTASTGFVFDVVWRDDDAVNAQTLDGGDLRLIGPDGVARRVRLSSVTASPDGRIITARYRLPTFSGPAFSPRDNGLYAVKLMNAQVADTTGALSPRRTLGNVRIRIT